mgnify:CR=1 FL=1|tara:strand:+ start:3299 stop:4270 length:972 start_codon:yes stop_codon:yes gene_type:complete
MKIAILGFDGYYGYPLYNRLKKNHNVIGLDNFWRRTCKDSPSLIPRKKPEGIECDVTNYKALFKNLNNFKPDVVIHLAEQRSAPYSMKSIEHKQYTIKNNSISTLNILECAKDLGFRTIHIGTMGVYGYNYDGIITEGDIVRGPGSVYHLSKCIDNSMFEMYSRLYKCNVVELHQGIIWGIGGRFDYDETFGTVLNRFILQRMIGMPFTLYGNGNQLRPFIHIENSLDCVELVINNPRSGFETYNQYTEIKRLSKLLSGDAENYDNPRIEDEDNNLESTNSKLINLGLKPTYINETEIKKIEDVIKPHLHNVKRNLICPKTIW